MVDVTRTNDDHVVTVVVGSTVVLKVINSEAWELISLTLDWLTEHVISVGVEVSILQSGVLQIGVGVLVISSELLLEDLKLSLFEGWVSNGITEHGNSTGEVILENGHTKR